MRFSSVGEVAVAYEVVLYNVNLSPVGAGEVK
jgi:hypothetical protein